MRSFTKIDLQYAHRFYGFEGEAQFLHGHSGCLTIEVEAPIKNRANMVYPCNDIYKTAWEVLQNFDHALVLRQDDPLLEAILGVYEAQGIRNGVEANRQKGPAFKTELAEAFPECRLVVTKETMTVEGLMQIAYDLLKDKLNIVKMTFTSGVNGASAEFPSKNDAELCPCCGSEQSANSDCCNC
ncbi:MAG: 6-carboxytetrahydropterin synthase [Eubacteriales bacterium]|nr:6-carboxytetrahydropterin synthase [Eubacteriales bacterium]